MNTAEVHAIEHLAATYLRNDPEFGDKIVYFGPMGCRTGFYLLLAGDYDSADIVPLVTRNAALDCGDPWSISQRLRQLPGHEPEYGEISGPEISGRCASEYPAGAAGLSGGLTLRSDQRISTISGRSAGFSAPISTAFRKRSRAAAALSGSLACMTARQPPFPRILLPSGTAQSLPSDQSHLLFFPFRRPASENTCRFRRRLCDGYSRYPGGNPDLQGGLCQVFRMVYVLPASALGFHHIRQLFQSPAASYGFLQQFPRLLRRFCPFSAEQHLAAKGQAQLREVPGPLSAERIDSFPDFQSISHSPAQG